MSRSAGKTTCVKGRRDRFAGFASDAEIFLITVNLRDAPAGEGRRKLLQVPTAFTIRDTEVTQLIDAGRQVLRASPEYQALRKSLGLSNAPAGAQ
jgi:NTE family protein